MPDGVKITVSTVQETREKDLITAEEIDEEMRVRCVGLGETGIWVHLRVTGKAAAEAMRFGFLKIDKAVDDTGENLALGRAPSLVGNYDDTTIDATKARVKDGFVMTVELSPAARKAAKIAALAGAFTMLCGGKQQEIVIQDVRSLVGKELQEPQLVKAGVKITPLKPDATAPEDADKKVGYALPDLGKAIRHQTYSPFISLMILYGRRFLLIGVTSSILTSSLLRMSWSNGFLDFL